MVDTDTDLKAFAGKYQWRMWIALAFVAIALLSACVWARHLMVMAAVNKGLGTPAGGLLAVICAGFAMAAPVYSAFLIALAPFSLNRRLILGIAWFGAVLTALAIGNIDKAKLGGPALFSQELIFGLPVISLGWLIPFSYLHWFKGWRLEFSGSERQDAREKITIATMLLLTFLVSLCFFSLQFASQRYIGIALVGMLVTSVLGSFLAIATWFVMRARLAILWFVFVGIAGYHLLSYVFFQFGAGVLAFENAMIITAVLLASLMGLIIMRVAGAKLLTGVPENGC